MNNFLFPVTSVPGTTFTEALALNEASAMYSLVGVPPAGARRFLIREIDVVCKDNFGPEFNFFSTATGWTTDPATDTFLSRWGFVATDGEQLDGTGLWRYSIPDLAIPYHDDDANGVTPPTLHVVLQNLSATAKAADAAGAMRATFWLEAMQAW